MDCASQLMMVLVAIDIGTDREDMAVNSKVVEVKEICRKHSIPIVFAMMRKELGSLTKPKRQSMVGIMCTEGADYEWARLQRNAKKARGDFYIELKRGMLMAEKPIVDLHGHVY
jgi:ribosomal protein L7Ae-like RNA K-turn-binding protein